MIVDLDYPRSTSISTRPSGANAAHENSRSTDKGFVGTKMLQGKSLTKRVIVNSKHPRSSKLTSVGTSGNIIWCAWEQPYALPKIFHQRAQVIYLTLSHYLWCRNL